MASEPRPLPEESPGALPDPERIGPYKVLEKLGEGGMGAVFLCQQEQPVRLRVAVKLIKVGMATKEVLARFEAERQALAMMNHPGIARVLGAGATQDGRPYFVMEHVQGVPLSRYCDQNKLTVRQRLLLFIQIAHAVQHAHHKGIIHRDLKPQNVLVTIQDDKPVPKIIDFGLAKATQSHRTGQSFYTEQGRVLGTPEYMSPEQADLTGLDIDTRTDVYALGVMLYELLTGDLPFDRVALRKAGMLEMQRVIQEEEPPKPSARVPTLGDVAEATKRRHTTLSQLVRELRGELDWITLKALEKDRTRRYATALEFAGDVERYLQGEPVLAGPPSGWYRVQNYLRRHRGPLVAAGAVIGALAVGMAVALVQRNEAKTQRAVAQDEARKAHESESRAEAARKEAQTHLDRYDLLKNLVTLQGLEREAETLWPEEPNKAPAMVDWLTRARDLGTRRARVATALDEVKVRARPLTPAETEVARRQHPKAEELLKKQERLSQARQELAALRGRKDLGEADQDRGRSLSKVEIPALEETGAALVAEIEATLLPRFPEPADQFLHDTLVKLLEGMDRLETESVASVQKRHAWASTVRQRTMVEEQAAWDRAIASIGNGTECPQYQGYRLTPQIGLVPLDRNPQSGLWEFWHVRSGARPEKDASGRHLVGDASGIVFVLVPGGTFWMGAQRNGQNADPEARADESPVHQVSLSPFFLSKYEMTQGQWQRWTGKNPSFYQPGQTLCGVAVTLHNPVEQVSWEDCRKVFWQMGLLLPTEAQWESACRAETTTVYSTGDDVALLKGTANIADAGSKDWYPAGWSYEKDFQDGHAVHAPVGSFAPNTWGLFDMHGNVWEWCNDEYGDYGGMPLAGNGERAGDRSGDRVFRGGSFYNLAIVARSAIRDRFAPELRVSHLGVRPTKACSTR